MQLDEVYGSVYRADGLGEDRFELAGRFVDHQRSKVSQRDKRIQANETTVVGRLAGSPTGV